MASARSVWFVGPRRVEVRDVEVPEPGEGQVVIRTTHSGISAGTELLAFRGQLDPELPRDETIGALGGTFRHPFPYGYSCVGVVERSRSDVAEGTQVFAFHPHQERIVVDAADVVPVPGVEPRIATMLPLVETGLQVALDAGPVLEQPVAVLGGGAIGLISALVLRRGGARVLVVEPRPWRRELALRIEVPAADPSVAADALAEMGAAGGAGVVVEASGNPAAAAMALDLLAHEGMLLVASWYGTQQVVLPLGGRFHRRRLTIRSTQVSTIPARLGDRWDRTRRLEAAVRLLGELPLRELATHQFAVDDAATAYRAVDEGVEGLLHASLGY